VRQSSNKWEGNAEYTGPTKSAGSERGPNKAAALAQATINPNGPTGLVPQKVDQQYDGIQQLKKPLNFQNQKESDDYKDTFNPDKKPDPGAYAQVKADPDAALRQKGTDYETANNANLSGKPYLVKAFNGDAVVRETSNRW
jgi:hypothetical protein